MEAKSFESPSFSHNTAISTEWDSTVVKFCTSKYFEPQLVFRCDFCDKSENTSNFTTNLLLDLQNHIFDKHVEQFFINLKEPQIPIKVFANICNHVLGIDVCGSFRKNKEKLCPLECSLKFTNWNNLKKHLVTCHFLTVCSKLGKYQSLGKPRTLLGSDITLNVWRCVLRSLTAKLNQHPLQKLGHYCTQAKTTLYFSSVSEIHVHFYTNHTKEFFRNLKHPNLEEQEYDELCNTIIKMEVYKAKPVKASSCYLQCPLQPCYKIFDKDTAFIVHLVEKHFHVLSGKLEKMQLVELEVRNCLVSS